MSNEAGGLRRVAEHLVRVGDASAETTHRGSVRHQERERLRATAGGGGRARAQLLDRLGSNAVPATLRMQALMIHGVADCIEVVRFTERRLNRPALGTTVRSVLDIGGQLAWLLDGEITAEDRVRRYLVWRFNDVKQERRLYRQFYRAHGHLPRVQQRPDLEVEARGEEQHLQEDVALAKWSSRPSVETSTGEFVAAALLGPDGKAQAMPKYTELVARVTRSPSIYNLLSVATHGAPFGSRRLDPASPSDEAEGFGLDLELAVAVALEAAHVPLQLMGAWTDPPGAA